MFVRRKVNKSGTVSVMVVDKRLGRYRIMRTFGAARTQDEVAMLEEKARLFIREAKGVSLSIFGDEREEFLEQYLAGITNPQVILAGPELVYGRLYDNMGFKNALRRSSNPVNNIFRHLVMCKLFNPGSKLRVIDYLWRSLGVERSGDKIYRYVDKFCQTGASYEGSARDQVESATRAHFGKPAASGPHDIYVTDMTSAHLDASEDADLRLSNAANPKRRTRVLVALLTTADGYPVGYNTFDGDGRADKAITNLLKRNDVSRVTVVARADALSEADIAWIDSQGHDLAVAPKTAGGQSKACELVCGTPMSDDEAARKLSLLLEIEREFGASRTDLLTRPVHSRIRSRVEGHACVCFTAYAVLTELRIALKAAGLAMTADRVRQLTSTMFRLNYTLPNTLASRAVGLEMTPDQKSLYDAVSAHIYKGPNTL